MDQTEGLNDAPGPLVYADTDVPQIPNADHSSITLSRETVRSLGFLSGFFLLFLFPIHPFRTHWQTLKHTLNWHSYKHTLWPTVTPAQDPVLKTIAITCHQDLGAAMKADQDLQEVSSVWKAQTRPGWARNQLLVHILLTPLLVLRLPPSEWGFPLSRGPVFDFQCSCVYEAVPAGWPCKPARAWKENSLFVSTQCHLLLIYFICYVMFQFKQLSQGLQTNFTSSIYLVEDKWIYSTAEIRSLRKEK